MFKAVPSKGNGDCFFDSVRIILKSVGVVRSVRQLRAVVAQTLADPHNRAANAALFHWAQMYSDALGSNDRELLQEFQHVSCLFDTERESIPFPLSTADRKRVVRQVMQSSFYGEEYSMQVLSDRFDITFVVIADGNVQKPVQVKKRLAFLELRRCHYQPVKFLNKFVWKVEQLPASVRAFLA